MFLRPDTLEGKKLQLYMILKFLKFVSGADVTSFKVMITILLVCVIFIIMLSQVKWAVDNKLLHTDIDE